MKDTFKEYLYIIFGVLLLSVSITSFYSPNELVMGGVSGLGIIIEYYSYVIFKKAISVGVTNFVVNIPLLIIGWRMKGKNFIGRTIFATIFFSIALILTEFLIPPFKDDIILVSIFGGIMTGVGIGFVFRGFATTGGTDLLATLIHSKLSYIPVSSLIFVMDSAIVILGFFVFGPLKAMYAVISIYISSKVINTILEGMSFSKAAFIISDKSDEISERLLNEIQRGVTALKGRGMYTKIERDILLCVFSQKEIAKVKLIVKNIDETSFIILTDVREVLGEGFLKN